MNTTTKNVICTTSNRMDPENGGDIGQEKNDFPHIAKHIEIENTTLNRHKRGVARNKTLRNSYIYMLVESRIRD